MPWAKQGCAHQINKRNWVNVQFSPAKFRKCFSFHQHLVLRHLVLHQNSRQHAGSDEEHSVSEPQRYGEKKSVQKETSESSQEIRGKPAEDGDRKYVLRKEKNNSVKC